MGNNTVTRFPFGSNNVPQDAIFADMMQDDCTIFHEYWNDFNTYTAAEWVVTVIGTGAAALAAGDGGWLTLTNSAANGDGVAAQKTPAAFSMTAGKKAFFKARLKVDDATLGGFVAGLQVVNTTPFAAGVTDGIYFIKATGAATLDVRCRKDATTGATAAAAIATIANDTFVEVGWYYNGVDKLSYSVNGVVLGTLVATAAFLPDTILSPVIAALNGSAVIRTVTVDSIYACFER